MRKIVRYSATAFFILAITTCDLLNPGLGAKVDITPPQIAITTPAGGSTVRGSFTITGTASDDMSLASVTARWGTQEAIPATLSGTAWTVTVPADNGLADGVNDIIMTATDGAVKTTETRVSLVLDNTPPTVVLTVPQEYGSKSVRSTILDVEGQIDDASTLVEIVLYVYDADGTQVAAKALKAVRSWSGTLQFSDRADVPAPLADNRSYRFFVRVKDAVGNENSYYYHAADIWAAIPTATSFPKIEDLGNLDRGALASLSNLTVDGLHALRKGPTGGLTLPDFLLQDSAKNPQISLSNLDPDAPVERNVLGSKVPVKGYVSVGMDSIRIDSSSIHATVSARSTTGTSWQIPTSNAVTIGTTVSFDIPMKDSSGAFLTNGIYDVAVEAKDAAGNGSVVRTGFLVDSSAPRIVSVTPADNSYAPVSTHDFGGAARSAVVVTVRTEDDNQGTTMSAGASYAANGTALLGVTSSTLSDVAGSGLYTATHEVAVPVDTQGLTTLYVELTATDRSGTPTTGRMFFNVDLEPPAVSVDAPAVGAWLSGSAATVSGTSSTDTSRVYVWFGASGAAAPSDISQWILATGSSTWSAPLSFNGLAEGAYGLYAKAFDVAGSGSAMVQRSFGIDQGNPSLEETAMASGTVYRTAAFSLTGTVSDTYALASLSATQSKDGGAATALSVSAVDGLKNASWSLDGLPSGGLADGIYEYALTATDKAGKSASIRRTVTVDATPPALAFVSVDPLVGTSTVNGVIRFTATATDANGLTGVRWWVLPAAQAAPSWTATGATAFASIPYAAVLDTTTLADADYKLWVGAQDKAGNAAFLAYPITVNQASDLPVLTLSNMNAAALAPGQAILNLQENNAKATGTATDDDSLDASTVSIAIDGGGFAPVSTVGSDGRSVGFEHSLSGLAEGPHSLSLRADDLATAKAGKPAVQAALGPVYFMIDRSPPEVSVTSHPSGTVSNAAFSLAGTGTDANGIAKVEASADGGGSWTILPIAAGPSVSWNRAVAANPDHGDDGLHGLLIRATDGVGKTTTVTFTCTIDTTPPAATVSVPAASPLAWLSGSTATASGTASDTGVGLSKVRWQVDSLGWADASGTAPWSASLNLSLYGEGQHTLYVKATDLAGNETAAAQVETDKRLFAVDQNPPDSTVTLDGAPFTATSGSRGAAFAIGGLAADTYALASARLEQKKDAGTYEEVAVQALSGASAGWSVAGLPRKPGSPSVTEVADGAYSYRITVTDASGKTFTATRTVSIDLTGPAVAVGAPGAGSWLLGTAYTVTGTADDGAGSGVAEIRYFLGLRGEAAPADFASWTAAGGTTSWSATINLTGLGEGEKTLHVRARDNAGNLTPAALPVDFGVDQSSPTWPSVGIASGTVYRTAAFSLTATGADTNALLSVSVTQSKDGLAAQPIAVAQPAAGDKSSDLNLTGLPRNPEDTTVSLLADGVYEYVLTVVDAASRQTQITRTVTVDTTKPVLSFLSVAPLVGTNTVNGVVSFTATVTDANGISAVRWWRLPAADSPAWDVGGTAFPSIPYAASDDTTGVATPADYKLWVGAMDKAGNTEFAPYAIRIDQGSDVPAIALASPWDPSASNDTLAINNPLDANAAVSGTMSDDDNVDASTIEISVDGGAFGAVTQKGSSGKSVSFQHDLSGLSEGKHYLSLKVWDLAGSKAGKDPASTTLGPVHFYVDKYNPTLSVTTSANPVWNTDTFLDGQASDANGLKDLDSDGQPEIEVMLDSGAWTMHHLTGNSWSVQVLVSVDHSMDGLHTVSIRAKDILGKPTNATFSFTVDTVDPAGAVATPSEGAVISGTSVSVIGTAADTGGTGVALVRFSLDGATWSTATGTLDWTANIDLAAQAEGQKTFHLRIVDMAGNVYENAAALHFNLDKAPPTASITAATDLVAATTYYNRSFTLSVDAVDTLLLGSITIVQSYTNAGGSTATTTPVNAAPLAGTSQVYAWPMTVDTVGNSTDGTYQFSVTVVDSTLKAAPVLTRTVVVDTTVPVLTVEGITAGYNATQGKVNGTATFKFSADGGLVNVEKSGSLYQAFFTVVADGTPVSTTAVAVAGWNPVSSASSVFTFTTDTKTWGASGTWGSDTAYDFYVAVRDAVTGTPNVAWNKTDVTANQNSDKPIVTATNLTLGVTSPLGQNPAILFTVEDDDSVDSSMIQYSIYTGSSWSAWADISPLITTDGTFIQAKTTLIGQPQGNGRIRFRAMDTGAGGSWAADYRWVQTGDNDYPFAVDYGPPSITVTSPSATSVHRADIAVSGSTQDASGVPGANIAIQIVSTTTGIVHDVTYTAATSPAISVTQGAGQADPVSFSLTIPISSLADAEYNLQVRCTDGSNTTGTLNIPIAVDKTAPTNAFSQPSDGSTVNGVVPVKGEVSDNRNIAHVYLWHGLASATPPAVPTGWTDLGTSLLWTYNVDTRAVGLGVTDAYKMLVITQDGAGNQSSPYTLGLNAAQASDRPAITLTNMVKEDSDPIHNPLGRNARVLGNVEDDDGINAGIVQIRLDIDNNGLYDSYAVDLDTDGTAGDDPNETEDWQNVTSQTGSGTLVSWSHDIANLTQGIHRLQVQARDKNSSGVGVYGVGTDYSWNQVLDTSFFIDFGPPVLTITGPSNGAIKTSDFLFTGTATDSFGIATVKISIDGGAEVDVTSTSGDFATWSYSYPVASKDGVHIYQVKAIDDSGAETTQDRQFVVDTIAPAAAVNTPQAAETVNGTLTVSGTASDLYQLDNVYYFPEKVGGVTPPDYRGVDGVAGTADDTMAGWTALNQTYSWTFPFNTVPGGDGNYILHVVPVDKGGNKPPTPFTRSFSVNQASDRPIIALTTLAAGGTYKDNLLPNTLQVAGTVSDDDGVDRTRIQIALDANKNGVVDGGETWIAVSGAPAIDGRVVTWSHTFSGLSDGQYKLLLRAADVTDAGAWGTYTSGTTAAVNFSVDTSPPTGTVTAPAQGAYTNLLAYTMQGTAWDANGISKVEIKVGTDTFAALTSDGYANWSCLYTASGDGQVAFQVIVTDTNDKVFTLDRYYTLDRVPPTVSFIQPGGGATVNGSMLVRGTVSDTYQVTETWFAIGLASAGAPAWPAGYQKLAGTVDWQKRVKTPDYADGSYKVWIVAKDVAGNDGSAAPESLAVTLSQTGNLPVVALTTANGTLFDNTGAITGTVTDDDGVDASTIEINLGSGWVPATANADGAIVSFSYALATTAESALPYTVQVRAYDLGEDYPGTADDIAPVLGTSSSIQIYKDNGAPSASIDTIDNGLLTVATLQGVYLKDRLTLTGTSTDGVGVSLVQARVLASGGESFESVNQDTTAYATWSWTKPGLVLTGSTVNLEMKVTDVHARTTTYAYTLLVDIVAPVAAIDTPDVNPDTVSGAYNGAVIFRGTASDGVKVERVYYLFASTLPADPDAEFTGWSVAGGSYGWNASLNTLTVNATAADSTHYLGVVAADSAGNRSSKQTLSFTINQGSDRPVLTLSTPTTEQVYGADAKMQGSTTDDDGLSSIELRVDVDNDGNFLSGGAEDYSPVSSPAVVSGRSLNLENPLSSLPDGYYRLQVRVRDSGYAAAAAGYKTFHETESAVIPFRIDTVGPTLTLDSITVQDRYGGAARVFTSSFNGRYVNNDLTFSFHAVDASGITDVSISVNGGLSWSAAAGAGGVYTKVLTVLLTHGFDGTRNIQYRAIDGTAKTTSGLVTLIVDTVEPEIAFTSPSNVTTNPTDDAPNVNGDVIVQGTVGDSSAVTGVTVTAGIADQISLTNEGNYLGWKVTLTGSGTYANATYAVDKGSNVWRLPVKVTATEYAGNRTVATGYLDVDPNSDRPVISIVSPANADSVAGVFLINGTVIDDDGAQSVLLQVDLNNDGNYDYILNLNGDGDTTDDFENEATAKTVSAANGVWSILMNGSGELNKSNLAARGLSGPTGTIGFRATPVDIHGTAGVAQTQSVYIDSESPIIKGLAADGMTEVAAPTPVTGTLQKGSVTVRALFKDDKDLLASSMQISFDGGGSFQGISTVSGATITDVGTTSPYQYRIAVPVDTTTRVSGGNGSLSIVLKVTDKTYKQTSATIEYSVDNTYPEVGWNLPAALAYLGSIPNEVYGFQGSGSTVQNEVFGKALDSGTVSGIRKINVYFVKGGDFVNPKTGATTPITTQTLRKSSLDRNGDGDYVDADEYVGADQGNVPFTEDANFVITIDKRTELGQFDTNGTLGDNDGFQESLKTKTGYDEWYAYFDSTKFTDGPVDVYFVAYDEAGNKVYGKALGQVANHPPSITAVEIDHSSTAYTGLFKAVGSLYLKVLATDVEGINASTYKATVSRTRIAPNGADTAATPVVGADYDVSSTGDGSAANDITLDVSGWTSGVQYSLTMEVKDTDGNMATTVLEVWVNNDDSTLPTVSIDPFSQTHVTGVSGHIEEAGNSPGADGDADLSGTVKVTGTAWDDGSVSIVELSFDGSTWTGTASLTQVASDPVTGTSYTWTYTLNTAATDWDSGTVGTQIAGLNRTIRARAKDVKTPTPNASGIASVTVDIVPYVTDVSTGFDTGMKLYLKRSVLGKYTVRFGGPTYTLKGYNFDATSTASIGGAAATVSFSSPDLVVTNNISTGGNVTVTTYGAASQNNTNGDLPQNREASAYFPNMTDDRKIAFWQMDSHSMAAYQGLTDAVMKPNNGRTEFDWMYAKGGQELWKYSGTGNATVKITGSTALFGGDFGYTTEGSLVFLFNHNSQWTFVDNTYKYIGSVQWGVIPSTMSYTFTANRDEAYNWNIGNKNGTIASAFPRLGLGNLSFLTNPTGYGYSAFTLGRYANLRLKTVGANAGNRNYVAYFDRGNGESRSIVFYGFMAGTDTARVTSTNSYYEGMGTTANRIEMGASWYATLDKYYSSSGSLQDYVSLGGTQANNNLGLATPRGRMDLTTVNSGLDSEFFDLGVRVVNATTHYGFLAYYDESNRALKIASNTGLYTADPMASGWNWSSATTVDATTAGAHVAMALDPNGGIHLAYQDTENGYLKYAYLTFNGSSFTVVKKVYVDALIAAGQYNSINVKDFGSADYRPVITTYSGALTGTNATLRVSYPAYGLGDANFGDGASSATGAFTGKWETVAVPAATNPQPLRTFTETDGASVATGRIHVGYNGSYLEEATYLDLP